MASLTNYLRNIVINEYLRGISSYPPANIWLGLFTTPTNELGEGVEVSASGYTRQMFHVLSPVGGTTYNTADIIFPTAASTWGNVGYLGIFDAATNGHMLFFGSLGTKVFINAGNTFYLPQNSLAISLL